MRTVSKWAVVASVLLLNLSAPAQAALPAPTPLSPSHTLIREAFPPYTWTKSPGATFYRVYVENASGLVYQSNWVSAATAGSCNAPHINTCNYRPTEAPAVPLTGGPHTWWVIAWSPGDGLSNWSSPKTFTLEEFWTYYPPDADSGAPYSTRTTGGERDQNSDLSLSWTFGLGPDYDATPTWYRLYLQDVTGVIYDQWHSADSICNPFTCNVLPIIPNGYATTGEVTWWVQPYADDATYGSAGYGSWTQPNWFRYRPTTGPGTNVPVIQSPSQEFVSGNGSGIHLFSWSLPAGATPVDEYWLTAGTSRGASDLFDGSLGLSASRQITGMPRASYVYLRLWHRRASKWVFNDWRFFSE